MPDARIPQLMDRLRAGDRDAADEVFRRFTHRLIALVRRRLQDRARRKEDPEDVVQSVYRSFFRRQRAGEFRLDDWDGVWGLLAVIAVRKCGNRFEYFRAARRDVRREADDGADGWRPACEAIARDPTPSEAAVLAETVEQLMRGLDEDDQSIITLHLQGHTVPEIARHVGYAERTVHRALERVRGKLRRQQADSPGAG